MHKLFTSITLLATLAAIAAMSLPGSALAGQPVTQTLTPPPPAFETCKATGSGTLCQGSRVLVEPVSDTGIVCGSGASAFDISYGDTITQVASRTYNLDGNLTNRFIEERYTSARFVNPVTGASLPVNAHDVISDVLAVPGDFSSATETTTGQFTVTLPGTGAVLLNVGRVVQHVADGFTESIAGPHQFLDLINGDPTVTQKLCTALGG
jgi:hypothetical protein